MWGQTPSQRGSAFSRVTTSTDREHTAFKGAQPTAVTSATVGLVTDSTSYEAEAAATTSSKTSAPHERGQPFWIQPVTWHKPHFTQEQLKQSCTFDDKGHYFAKVVLVLVPWINLCNGRCFHTTAHKVNASLFLPGGVRLFSHFKMA